MIVGGFAKQCIFRTIDMACPGAGLTAELVDRAFHFFTQKPATTKNEQQLKIISILCDSGADV